MTPAYIEVLVKLFILIIGFVMGFLLACAAAARIITEKNDIKLELAKLRGEADQLKTYNKELFDENQKLNATLAAHKIPNPTFKF